jgi:hypothetical protein
VCENNNIIRLESQKEMDLKLKLKLFIVFLLVALMASGASAMTSYNWDVNMVAKWNDIDGANWVDELGTPIAEPDGLYEVKIKYPGSIVTLDTAEGQWSYTGGGTRMRVYQGATLNVVDGGDLRGFGWIRIGEASGNPEQIGFLNQSGGTVFLGKYKDAGKISIGDGAGIKQGSAYTMTGGTLTYDTANSACAGQLIIGSRDGEGTFVVVGDTPVIHMKNLYVAGEKNCNYSSGTLEFKIGSGGVSPINLDGTAYIDQGSNTMANLVVSLTAAPLIGENIILVNANSTVQGVFDSLNGGSATQGAALTLNFGGLNYGYSLTYAGGDGNDIALLWVPEPATAALISLGLLFIARRR